ncbi:Large-conductance mechanosensitive channel [Phytophthora cactorum]|nr:Large-conductance mechanosensitive channel [Phytophthora cactorum]
MVSSVLCRQWPTLRRWNPFAPPPPPPESASLLDRMQEFANRELLTSRALLTDFQDFIQQGNMIDMAVGLILGSSFSAILDSLVVDIMSPIISLVTGRSWLVQQTGASPTITGLCHARLVPLNARMRLGRLGKSSCLADSNFVYSTGGRGCDINYGLFVENAVTFPLMLFSVFRCQERALHFFVCLFEVVFKRDVLVKKQCPYCKEFVKGDATRCKYCSSGIEYPSSSRGFGWHLAEISPLSQQIALEGTCLIGA